MSGQPSQIEEKFWMALKRNEPNVKELTKKQYENNRGIKQAGPGSEGPNDGGKAVEKNPVPASGVSLSGANTKKEIITELLKRDGSRTGLQQKTKKVLLEML